MSKADNYLQLTVAMSCTSMLERIGLKGGEGLGRERYKGERDWGGRQGAL